MCTSFTCLRYIPLAYACISKMPLYFCICVNPGFFGRSSKPVRGLCHPILFAYVCNVDAKMAGAYSPNVTSFQYEVRDFRFPVHSKEKEFAVTFTSRD